MTERILENSDFKLCLCQKCGMRLPFDELRIYAIITTKMCTMCNANKILL